MNDNLMIGATIVRFDSCYPVVLVVEKSGKRYQITDACDGVEVERIKTMCATCNAISKCNIPSHHGVSGCHSDIRKKYHGERV